MKESRAFVAALVLLALSVQGAREGEGVQERVHLQDLSSFSADFYLSFDPKEDVGKNAHNAFKHFAAKSGIDKELTADELKQFEARFTDEVETEAKSENLVNKSSDAQAGLWEKEVRRAVEDQKPVVTDQLVKDVNAAKAGWRAKKQPWMRNMSKNDLVQLNGLVITEEDQKRLDKANSKKKAIAKSIVFFEVKPLESETDLDVLFTRILKEVVMDGCDWKQDNKKEPVAFGVFKLIIGCVIEDDKVSTDDIEEQICGMEDMVHEIYTVGPHFKQVSNFLWPFKLSAPRGGFKCKRHGYCEIRGGDWGNREELINELVSRMN